MPLASIPESAVPSPQSKAQTRPEPLSADAKFAVMEAAVPSARGAEEQTRLVMHSVRKCKPCRHIYPSVRYQQVIMKLAA